MAATDKLFAGSIPEIYDRLRSPHLRVLRARSRGAAGCDRPARCSGDRGRHRSVDARDCLAAAAAGTHHRDRFGRRRGRAAAIWQRPDRRAHSGARDHRHPLTPPHPALPR